MKSVLEDNFKKLKDILDKNKNFVKILEYTKEKKEKVQDSIENCFESDIFEYFRKKRKIFDEKDI